MIKAMILAAGRGERMRPLSDTCPKPLLKVGGQALIIWTIQRLARAGFKEIVINHAWLGEQLPQTLGDGSQWQVHLTYSAENPALETAGGIAHALPLLGEGICLVVSADIYTDFDFSQLLPRAQAMAQAPTPQMHLVLVDNPEFHPNGDFYLQQNQVHLTLTDAPQKRLTYANIGLYDTRSFLHLDPNVPTKLAPVLHKAIEQNCVSGEYFSGIWHNIGTVAQLHAVDKTLEEI